MFTQYRMHMKQRMVVVLSVWLCCPSLLHYELTWLVGRNAGQLLTVEAIQRKITPGQKHANDVNPIFTNALSVLLQRCRLPILLPYYLANESEINPLYATIINATVSEYSVVLGFSEGCEGGNACRWGTASGKRVRRRPQMSGKRVVLSKGITGYYVESVCGAVCSDSTVTWYLNRCKYSVGIKAARQDVVVRVANSAIERADSSR